MLMRASQQHEDQWLALLKIRNTPRQDILASPAKIMFGRPTRTVIPVLTKKVPILILNDVVNAAIL